METHAHDLHKAPGHGWKHYFFEFFMLFLAVFCGFFAENLREQSVERHREKEYIVSMIEDLKSDTESIAKFAIYRNDRRRRMDSLSWLLLQPDYLQHTALIYFYARWVPRNSFFTTNDRTFQQLKNAGGMRLITSRAAVDVIMNYDAQVKIVNTQEYDQENNEVHKFVDKMTSIFDGNVLDNMYQDSLLIKPPGNPALLTTDPRVLNSCITQLHFVKSLNRRNIYFENNLKTLAVKTIRILKQEYQIE